MEIKDLTGLSKPLTRLIEVISEGVGAVSRPYLLKRNAEAKAQEIRVISEALREVMDKQQLSVIYKEGDVEVWQKPEDKTLRQSEVDPEERILSRVDYQERKRQRNVEQITSVAARCLLNEEDVAEDKPDEDWVTRFFSAAQDVSSEQMQVLWGRILAGEIKRPGAYSLRTLDFLKNLTKADASLIERISKFAVRYGDLAYVAAHDMAWLEENRQVFPGDHFAIGELGAMYPTDLNYRIFRDASVQEEVFFSGDLVLIVERGEISSEIQLPIWKFTTIGQELLALVPDEHDEAYLETLGMFFVKNKGIATLARVVEHRPDEGQVKYPANYIHN